MIISRYSCRVAALALSATIFLSTAALAQDVSESHIQAALRAVQSAKASRGFDNVLPTVAERVQSRLVRVRPDLHKEIADAVEEVALNMVALRTELDERVAAAWAASFTEEELEQIAEFYDSAVGQKFADVGPRVIQQTLDVVQQWSVEVGGQMMEQSQAKLKEEGVEF